MQAAAFKSNILNSEAILAICIIFVLAIMLIPLPSMVMDALLAINLTIAILILFISLYSIEPLDFSTLPSILLVTTLFRLALNIASTRLILLNGNSGSTAAGQIIQAFGQSVVGGNYFIGIIVFLILVLINFIVITKGAGRIAEVGARFALDAMPGKQMAIDADLNAGILDEKTAQERRQKIQRESDFYGAMDGANKFVRGDAIAGLIITAINIIGGLIIGIFFYNMDILRAAETFTILTIGDGLVGQIPALVISTAAGITVSKAGRQNSLGKDFGIQLFKDSKVLVLVSVTMFMFIFIDQMPKIPFILLGILFGYLAWSNHQNNLKIKQAEEDQKELEQTTENKDDEVSNLLHLDALSLDLGYGLIPLVDQEQDGELLERIRAIRKQIALDFGFVLPSVHIKDNLHLEAGGYSIMIKGIESAKGEMQVGKYLAMATGDIDEKVPGIDTTEPAFGLPAIWVSEKDRENAEVYGYTVVDVPTVISTHLTEVIKNNAHLFLGRQEVQKLIDKIAEHEPKLVEELLPNILHLGAIQRILQELLKEKVSIRDLSTILETLSDYGSQTKDTITLVEFARQSIAKSITLQYINDAGELPVMMLDFELDKLFENALEETTQGILIILDQESIRLIRDAFEIAVEKFALETYQPVFTVSSKIRPHIKKFMDRIIPNLVFLSHNEIYQDIKIQSLGQVNINQEDYQNNTQVEKENLENV